MSNLEYIRVQVNPRIRQFFVRAKNEPDPQRRKAHHTIYLSFDGCNRQSSSKVAVDESYQVNDGHNSYHTNVNLFLSLPLAFIFWIKGKDLSGSYPIR